MYKKILLKYMEYYIHYSTTAADLFYNENRVFYNMQGTELPHHSLQTHGVSQSVPESPILLHSP